MPISERMLRKWRGESLVLMSALEKHPDETLHSIVRFQAREMNTRILLLTQELLDQALLRKETKP